MLSNVSLTRVAAFAAIALVVAVLFDSWRVARAARERPVKLEVAGLEPGDRLGASVAIDGDWLAVGAPGDDEAGQDAGAVYAFRRAGLRWVPGGEFRAEADRSTRHLGRALALSAGRLAIAADDPGVDATRGSVFVFVAPTTASEPWSCEAVLTSPEASGDDAFGCALALDGDTLLVGAWGDHESAKLGGAVHVFERRDGTWTRTAKLLASEGRDVAKLGTALALSGSTALVGAPGDDEHGGSVGAAYVFERDASGVWREVARLATGAGEVGGALGSAVALDGDIAAISAPRTGQGADLSSAVFVFERRGELSPWSESARLVLGATESGLSLGDALALRGERVIVGAAGDSDHGDSSGAALVFVAGGEPRAWRGLRKLVAPDAGARALFGWALAQSQRNALIGAPGVASESGAAYVVELGGRARAGE